MPQTGKANFANGVRQAENALIWAIEESFPALDMGKQLSAAKKGPPEAGLKAEVQAFASGLGLASAGNNGFHDADFRPGAGKRQKVKVAAESQVQTDRKDFPKARNSKKTPPQLSGKQPTTDPRQTQRPVQENGTKPQHRMRVPGGGGQNQLPNVKERQWNSGVGSRPGRPPCKRACKSKIHTACT